jgi:hypothetical protein
MAQPPGWYPDPGGSGGSRWWDGEKWAQSAAPGPGAVGAPVAETDGYAIASLVLAVLGIPILPIIFGYSARRRIRESGGTKQGDGLALAGIVIGWITVAIFVLTILFIIIVAIGVA